MQANELRIGNVVNKFGEIAKLTIDDFYLISIDGDDFLNGLQPIPLTPKILQQCGFKGDGDIYFNTNDTPFSYIKADAYDCNGNFGYCLNDEKVDYLELKYLHQLQNLYFALTGRELEVNL